MKKTVLFMMLAFISMCAVFPIAYADAVHYANEDGRVTFDAMVYGSENVEAPILNARYRFWDVDTLAAKIYRQRDYQVADRYEEGPYNNVTFEGSGGTLYVRARSNIKFSTTVSTAIDEIMNQTHEMFCRASLPSYDMDFMDRAEMEVAATNLMASLGLDCGVQAIYSINEEVYNVSYEGRQKFNQGLTEEDGDPIPLLPKVKWPDPDIAYVVFLQQRHEGIPLYRYTYQLARNRGYVRGTNVVMGYGKDGLIRLEVADPIEVVGREASTSLLSYAEAAQIFTKDRNMILGEASFDYLVTKMSLEYIADYKPMAEGTIIDKPFALRPAWVLESIKPWINEPQIPDMFLVDAISGDVMEA